MAGSGRAGYIVRSAGTALVTRPLVVVLICAATVVAPALLPSRLAAQGPERFSGPSSQSLLQLFDEYWEWTLAQFPETATFFGRVEHNNRWTDLSKAARDRVRAARREYLQRVMYLSPGTLTPSMQFSAFLMEAELRDALESEPYLDAIMTVSQMTGAHNMVFEVVDAMPAATVRDYENIITRIRALPPYVDQTIGLAQEHLAAGLAQPAVVVDLMLDQVVAQRQAHALDSPLLAAFQTFPDTIAATAQRRLRAAAVAAYDQQFVPSWTRLETFLRETYRPRARPQIGLSSAPDGRVAYARLVRHFTTTKMAPEQIHEIGLREVERIEREMSAIARDYGFTGPVSAFEQELRNRPGMRFESQDEMIAYAQDVLANTLPVLPRLFRHVPRMAIGVRPIPPDREASTASNYASGTADGTRQAWFNMNTYRPQDQAKYPIEALVLHETVPGHHLQVGLAREMEDVPSFQRAFGASAFSEGWALYAESLGTSLGTVYRDPATRFGQLSSQNFRAVRLVVDTGIHAMGWSRERAREYFAQHVPSQSIAEVDRYIALPGQALAYKIGQLEIVELRDRAQQALGPRFDIRDFHDAVLRHGAMPLDMLEEQIDAYITDARAH